MNAGDEPHALRLFRCSVLKQAKLRALERMIPDPAGKSCLDLGSDNGVISYLLRERGGRWTSADLAPKAVEAIRALVHSDVHQIDGRTLPFADGAFDLVVVIDMLEHVPDDRLFARELTRIVRPGGELVVNVPHLVRSRWARKLRDALGIGDDWHGHLRAGYDLAALEPLFGADFDVVESFSYSKAFSELLDIALNYAYARRKGGKGPETSKGTIVTGAEAAKMERELRLLSGAYPVLHAFAGLDRLCPTDGYFLIVKARRKSGAPPARTGSGGG